jgi:hypothetical protein
VLRTSRNDHHVVLAADPLFAAEAELYLVLSTPAPMLHQPIISRLRGVSRRTGARASIKVDPRKRLNAIFDVTFDAG